MDNKKSADKKLSVFSKPVALAPPVNVPPRSPLAPSAAASVSSTSSSSQPQVRTSTNAPTISTASVTNTVTTSSRKKNPKRRYWRKEDDDKLFVLVKQFGISSRSCWRKIATYFFDRTPKQCRERWENYLDPALKLEYWSHKEEKLIVKLQKQYGNRWKLIAEIISEMTKRKRSTNAVKNYWHMNLKNRAREVSDIDENDEDEDEETEDEKSDVEMTSERKDGPHEDSKEKTGTTSQKEETKPVFLPISFNPNNERRFHNYVPYKREEDKSPSASGGDLRPMKKRRLHKDQTDVESSTSSKTVDKEEETVDKEEETSGKTVDKDEETSADQQDGQGKTGETEASTQVKAEPAANTIQKKKIVKKIHPSDYRYKFSIVDPQKLMEKSEKRRERKSVFHRPANNQPSEQPHSDTPVYSYYYYVPGHGYTMSPSREQSNGNSTQQASVVSHPVQYEGNVSQHQQVSSPRHISLGREHGSAFSPVRHVKKEEKVVDVPPQNPAAENQPAGWSPYGQMGYVYVMTDGGNSWGYMPVQYAMFPQYSSYAQQ